MFFDFLIEKVQGDFPEIEVKRGRKFAFRWPNKIFVQENNRGDKKFFALQLLHEVGHFVLGHREFGKDVERLKMERAAWEEARKLCEKYGVEYDEEFVEEELDSYRDWLHRRSKCPQCGMTRWQDQEGRYICPECDCFEGGYSE